MGDIGGGTHTFEAEIDHWSDTGLAIIGVQTLALQRRIHSYNELVRLIGEWNESDKTETRPNCLQKNMQVTVDGQVYYLSAVERDGRYLIEVGI